MAYMSVLEICFSDDFTSLKIWGSGGGGGIQSNVRPKS